MSTRSRQPVHLILDWDGTLTERDTLHLVAKIGYDKQGIDQEQGSDPQDRDEKGQFILPWSEYGRLYLLDYGAHKDEYRPLTDQRTTLEAERRWLRTLGDVESDSALRVQGSCLFRGVSTADIVNGAEGAVRRGDLKLRKGWEGLLRHIIEDGSKSPQSNFRIPNMQRNKIDILSVNWSELFIRKALHATQALTADPGTVRAEEEQGKLTVDDFRLVEFMEKKMVIHANEIQGHDVHGEGGSDGTLCARSGDIRTSRDKADRMPERCQEFLETGVRAAPAPNQAQVLYVGDSNTDLECLLAADYGICIRDEPIGGSQAALAETLERLKINVVPVDQIGSTSETHRLYLAQDFEEIHTAMQNAGLLSKP